MTQEELEKLSLKEPGKFKRYIALQSIEREAVKEDFLEFVRTREPELAKKIVLEDTSSIGVSGFQEVLRRGAVDRIMQESRIGREATLIEELMKEISMDGKAAYGMVEVRSAQGMGAVETLLITDELLRTERESYSIDRFFKDVEDSHGLYTF